MVNEFEITPVDMAGFCGHTEAVRGFCKDLKERIVNENKARMDIVENSDKPTSLMETAKLNDSNQIFPLHEENKKKKIIYCKYTRKQELVTEDKVDLRIFYWAAYYGMKKTLIHMIESRRWSPFMKSYKNRSVISAAIWGNQIEMVRFILGDY